MSLPEKGFSLLRAFYFMNLKNRACQRKGSFSGKMFLKARPQKKSDKTRKPLRFPAKALSL